MKNQITYVENEQPEYARDQISGKKYKIANVRDAAALRVSEASFVNYH